VAVAVAVEVQGILQEHAAAHAVTWGLLSLHLHLASFPPCPEPQPPASFPAAQADRKQANQRQRVHITLELAWSADKTVQQLGRTHRSNQRQPPRYIIVSSDISGEHRWG
jgi:hypothetical protein